MSTREAIYEVALAELLKPAESFEDVARRIADAVVTTVARASADKSWESTPDRLARTAPGRRAAEARFLEQAEGDPVRAAELKTAFFRDLAEKSAATRRRNAEQRAAKP